MDIIKVFISYAHESDEFRESIRKLAIWLNTHGKNKIIVTTDHLHSNKAPKEGWQIWMHKQIEESGVVLIACTPKYKKRFEKKEGPAVGRGVIFEGAIVTTELYNSQMYNEKFIPIIPDDGSENDVPVVLQPFFNNLRFEVHNDRIMMAILNENQTLSGYEESADAEDRSKFLLENEIVNEIFDEKLKNQEKTMLPSIHTLVRSFLELSDAEKIKISKKLHVFEEKDLHMFPDARDKKHLKAISDQNLVSDLWDAVNDLKPFHLKINPFKKT